MCGRAATTTTQEECTVYGDIYGWFKQDSIIVVVVVVRPLLRSGDMTENHEAPEAGKPFKAWTRSHRETESRQRVSGAKSPLLDSEDCE